MRNDEFAKQVNEAMIQFYNIHDSLTYSEALFIEKVVENITNLKPAKYGFDNLTVTEKAMMEDLMDFLNRRIKIMRDEYGNFDIQEVNKDD